jgi:tetratricopeptide (TPR) repeat protein
MGNCYSLQKDHETALKNFQRAVQLNPRFAYAHTLCGHEYDSLNPPPPKTQFNPSNLKSCTVSFCVDG